MDWAKAYGPVPIGLSSRDGTSRSSAGMMTMGTLKALNSVMKVGCTFFMWTTKVYLSGASQWSTSSSMLRSSPTLE